LSNKILVKNSSLNGKVRVSGAKNSALRLLAASLLTNESVVLNNSPNKILDMQIHIEMLKTLGKNCIVEKDKIIINENNFKNELVWTKRSIRNTLLILGALTTRSGFGKVPLPGGCKLGDRKYDLHVMILEKFGCKVWEEDQYLLAENPKRFTACDIFLPIRSTGATENAILCATLAKGKTTIWGPHIRPEIIDLTNFLNKMGAKIEVFGQKNIIIHGVEHLRGVNHQVIPDNIEALTWLISGAMTGGEIDIYDFPYKDLEVPLIFLKNSGVNFKIMDKFVRVRGSTPFPIEISTGPFPGINSDMQPLFAAYAAKAEGQSKIIDLRFHGRYGYAKELAKMGMKYSINNGMLIVRGGEKLVGCEVEATDLRAGIALLISGLCASGDTIINEAWQIFRGYDEIIEKLNSLGAQVKTINEKI